LDKNGLSANSYPLSPFWSGVDSAKRHKRFIQKSSIYPHWKTKKLYKFARLGIKSPIPRAGSIGRSMPHGIDVEMLGCFKVY
jgi:hypothetical protein